MKKMSNATCALLEVSALAYMRESDMEGEFLTAFYGECFNLETNKVFKNRQHVRSFVSKCFNGKKVVDILPNNLGGSAQFLAVVVDASDWEYYTYTI